MSRFPLALAAVLAMLAPPPALADGGPAVSGLNGKLGLVGGAGDVGASVAVEGSVTVPLSYSFGAQVDGLLGDLDGDLARGAALHLFWRDPGLGMAGLMFSRVELGGAALTRAGVEGEVYRGDWTFAGQIGRQGGDVAEETYASLGAVRYFDGGMRLDFGVEGVGGRVTARAGAEWALGEATSLRVAAIGGEGDAMLSVGVQMTFGGSGGGLQARDRRDDPVNGLFETLVGQARGLRGAQCPVRQVSFTCDITQGIDALCSSVTLSFDPNDPNVRLSFNGLVDCNGDLTVLGGVGGTFN